MNRAMSGKQISADDLDYIFDSALYNKWVKLVLARMLMRKRLREIFHCESEISKELIDLRKEPDFSGRGDKPPSLRELLELTKSDNRFTPTETSDLKTLSEITNLLEWGGRKPTRSEWKWALQNCKNAVKGLFDK